MRRIFNKYTSLNDWALCLVLSVSAICINTFGAIPIYGTISIYIGSIFALLSLLLLPLLLSLIVLSATLVSFYYQLNDITFVLVQAFEYLFVLAFVRKGLNFLVAVFSFWAFIGLPIIFSIMYFLARLDLQTSSFISITIGLNGGVCGIIALLVYWFIPGASQFKRFNPPPPRFSNVVFELCIVSVILPTILVTLVFTWRSTEETEKQISKELSSAAMQFENIISGRMDHNVHTVSSAAATLIDLSNTASDETGNIDKQNQYLNAIAKSNVDIESMVLTEADGNVLIAAPQKYSDILEQLKPISVADRYYFDATKQTQLPYVSKVLISKGLEKTDIIAITAPIIKEGKFDGLVQASVALVSLINPRAIETVENNDIDIIITDKADAVIYSSSSLALAEKSKFIINRAGHPFLRQTPVMLMGQDPYIYQFGENTHGWKIYTLASPNKVFASIVDYFLFIGLTILFSVILIAILASRLASKITFPLVNLEKFLAYKLQEDDLLPQSNISREIAAVTRSLIKARAVSRNFEEQLKKQVSDKTRALKELNEKLFETSQRDALTKLYNRGAFDSLAENTFETCIRNKIAFTIVLIDIDFFKKINDRYGHIVGDKCIIHVANILQNSCKRNSDIVARYGGEEYILLLSGTQHEKHLSFIEEIHRKVQQTPVLFEGKSIRMTVSCGVVRVAQDFSTDFDKLLSLTDEQLYKSKNNGRNQVTTLDL